MHIYLFSVAEKHTKKKVEVFCIDRKDRYLFTNLQPYFNKSGIKHILAIPYNSEHNGVP